MDPASGTIGQTGPGGRLVFTVNTYDTSPVFDAQWPTFIYMWWLTVDGGDSGYGVQAGYVGGPGTVPPTTDRFFRLCRRAATGFSCGTTLTGTIGDNTATIEVLPSQIGAGPGAVIEGGTGQGTDCPGVCSTWQPWAFIFHNTGGDSAVVEDGYIVPGSVRLAVVPASTPDGQISFATPMTMDPGTGEWTGTVSVSELVPGNEYKAAARTCAGSTASPACVVTTTLFTA